MNPSIEIVRQYRAIEGQSDYWVSSDGQVLSLFRRTHGRKLKGTVIQGGYRMVRFANRGYAYVHRLVASAWIGRAPTYTSLTGRVHSADVNHKDGVKLHNDVRNLEWCTRSVNNTHALREGLRAPTTLKGAGHGMAKLTDEDVRAVRTMRQAGETYKAIGEHFGVHESTIGLICRGVHWKHLA